MQNLKRRVAKIEERFGMGRDDEIVELPLPDGRIARTTRPALDGFLAWLKARESSEQETIETN